MKFINRQKELGYLNTNWEKENNQFIIIYGKRRIGKTELTKQFIKDKPAVYYLADKTTVSDQLKEMGRLIGDYFGDEILSEQGFPSWLDVFKYLKKNCKKKFVLAVDEYPYLVESDFTISSIFQKGWDEYLKNSKITLILTGSSVGMMESETLSYKSPLYGRRTGQIKLLPLTFKQSNKFFPEKSFEEFMPFYAVAGGMPAYLLQFDGEKSTIANIKEKIFPTTEYLHNEVEFILKEELREPKNYLSILKSIAWGKAKFSEITNETAIDKNSLSKYLGTLEKLSLIEREVPITEKNPHKSRKGIYKICDNFTRFWFQYIFQFRSQIEISSYAEPVKKLTEDNGLLILEAISFEKICQEIVSDCQDRLFNFERIGRWWEKNEEIDLVALNSQNKQILFGEAKWSNKKIGLDIIKDLKRKSKLVEWSSGSRKEYFALFSKSGFTNDMVEYANNNRDIFLFHQDKLIGK
jgi:AAA+ ATPase superfamily predicted ATPase